MRFLIAVLIVIPALAFADDLTGSVSKWVDGDTFWIGRVKIRLCGINAPERGRPGYREANKFIQQLIGRQSVRCIPVGSGTPCDGRSKKRSHDRVVMQCFVGKRDVAGAMVRSGHARDWPRFSGGFYQK